MKKALRRPRNLRSASDFSPVYERNEAMHTVAQVTTALPRYTECLLDIADAYLTYGLRHGGLSLAHWDSLVRKGYRK